MEEKAYQDGPKLRNQVIGESKSELDRLASVITHQEQLIRELQQRLRAVSRMSDSDKAMPASPEDFHLSAFINRIDQNNHVLEEIHKELAI